MPTGKDFEDYKIIYDEEGPDSKGDIVRFIPRCELEKGEWEKLNGIHKLRMFDSVNARVDANQPIVLFHGGFYGDLNLLGRQWDYGLVLDGYYFDYEVYEVAYKAQLGPKSVPKSIIKFGSITLIAEELTRVEGDKIVCELGLERASLKELSAEYLKNQAFVVEWSGWRTGGKRYPWIQVAEIGLPSSYECKIEEDGTHMPIKHSEFFRIALATEPDFKYHPPLPPELDIKLSRISKGKGPVIVAPRTDGSVATFLAICTDENIRTEDKGPVRAWVAARTKTPTHPAELLRNPK